MTTTIHSHKAWTDKGFTLGSMSMPRQMAKLLIFQLLEKKTSRH